MGHAHHTPSRFIAVMNWTIATGITHSVVEAEGNLKARLTVLCLWKFLFWKKKFKQSLYICFGWLTSTQMKCVWCDNFLNKIVSLAHGRWSWTKYIGEVSWLLGIGGFPLTYWLLIKNKNCIGDLIKSLNGWMVQFLVSQLNHLPKLSTLRVGNCK